jgi:hypothetical protein
MSSLSPVKRLASRGQISFSPWDAYSIVGNGSPNPQTGEFSNYTIKIWPGSVGGVVPDKIFEELSVSNSLQYLVLTAQTNNGVVSSATISFQGSASIQVQTATPYQPPGTFKTIVGAWNRGSYFNIKKSNINPVPLVSFITSETNSTPFGLSYREHYIWGGI